MRRPLELAGKRYGRLVVIKRVENDKWDNSMWLCKCDCGNEKKCLGTSLKAGDTKSCGCLKEECLLGSGVSCMRQVIKMYKHGAKRRGLEYDLTEEQFAEITQKDCFYCGAKPNNERNVKGYNGKYLYNGIDRIDNTEGYIAGNIVSCCYQCNLSKGKLTLQEFKAWVKKVYEH